MNRQTRDKVESENAAYLGVVTADLSTEAIQMYDMPEGAFVIRVEKNSAAGKAGIQKGDIIVSFDGQTVSGKDDLESKLAYYAPVRRWMLLYQEQITESMFRRQFQSRSEAKINL